MVGGIVGILIFGSCCADYKSEWAERGFYHWGIKTAMRGLAFHPCKGRLGFFEVDYPYDLF